LPIEKGTSSFRNLLTRDAIFQIPIYQRYYSWEEKHLEDLWNDLFYLNPEKNTTMAQFFSETQDGLRKKD